jgi:hypothetical protein
MGRLWVALGIGTRVGLAVEDPSKLGRVHSADLLTRLRLVFVNGNVFLGGVGLFIVSISDSIYYIVPKYLGVHRLDCLRLLLMSSI